MPCKNACTKAGIEYILCKLEPPPQVGDRAAIVHSMCPYQYFCEVEQRFKLAPEAALCAKMSTKPQEAAQSVLTAAEGTDTQEQKKPYRKSQARSKRE